MYLFIVRMTINKYIICLLYLTKPCGRQPGCASLSILILFTFSCIPAMSINVFSLPTARNYICLSEDGPQEARTLTCAYKELELPGNRFPSSDNGLHQRLRVTELQILQLSCFLVTTALRYVDTAAWSSLWE